MDMKLDVWMIQSARKNSQLNSVVILSHNKEKMVFKVFMALTVEDYVGPKQLGTS